MIRYALACDKGHVFESWFQSSAAYDKQVKAALITCPVCNSVKVEKTMMAPGVLGTKKKRRDAPPSQMPPSPQQSSNTPSPVAMMSPQERDFRNKLKELRDHLTKNADYVGRKFPEEARKMHYGGTEPPSIYRRATPQQGQKPPGGRIESHPLPGRP